MGQNREKSQGYNFSPKRFVYRDLLQNNFVFVTLKIEIQLGPI